MIDLLCIFSNASGFFLHKVKNVITILTFTRGPWQGLRVFKSNIGTSFYDYVLVENWRNMPKWGALYSVKVVCSSLSTQKNQIVGLMVISDSLALTDQASETRDFLIERWFKENSPSEKYKPV